MEGSGLDLGKILKMVTDNPALVQSAMAFAGKMRESSLPSPPAEEPSAPAPLPLPTPSLPNPNKAREDERRLLMALRPYLNETRKEKIDFVLKILQLLELAGTLGLTLDGKGGGKKDV